MPPLRSIAAIAAFFSNFFFPASAFGTNEAMTMATMAKITKTLKYFIVTGFVCSVYVSNNDEICSFEFD